jgi:hypothetical protein
MVGNWARHQAFFFNKKIVNRLFFFINNKKVKAMHIWPKAHELGFFSLVHAC